jgi:hypothetical protein
VAGIPNPNTPSINARGGGNSAYANSVATTAASTQTVTLTQPGAATAVVKYYATLTLESALNVAVGSKITVAGITPTGYRTGGTGVNEVTGEVTDVSDEYPYTVSYEVRSALGAQSVAGSASVAGSYFDTGDYGTVGTSANLLGNNTEANVKSFYGNESTLDTVKNQLIAGLNPNLPLPLAILEAVAKALLRGGYDLVLGVITTAAEAADAVVDVIGKVADWIGEAIDTAGKIIGDLGQAIVDGIGTTFQNFLDFLTHGFGKGNLAGIGVTTGTNVNDLADAVHNLTDKAFVAVDDTATLTSFWNEPRQLPSWIGAQSDDVSYPHYLINASANTIFGTGATTTQDRLILIPVVAGQNRVYDVIKFGVTAMTATSLQVGLYDVNETTGEATKVVDLGNVISQINLGVTIQTILLPQEKEVQKGEVFYIAILASGGTVTLSYSSTISGTSLVNYGRYPRFLASFNSSGIFSVLPATMPNAQLSSDGTFRPFWGAAGVFAPNVIPAKLALSDSFDRANATTLGANWSRQYSQFGTSGLKIVSNKARSDINTGSTYSMLVQRMNWLDQRVSATLTREGYYSRVGMILILRGNGLGKFMYLRVTQNLDFSINSMYTTAQIFSATSYSQVGTNFQGGTARSTVYSVNGSINQGPTVQTWKFEAIGNAYYAYLNNTIVRTWTDDGGGFTYTTPLTNDTHKQVGVGGLYVPRNVDGLDLLGMQTNGVSIIDNFTATDL